MYVRLAFAVAAHMEPEILVVDEVLAVGDAEFQKKCLGKMNEVSHKEGRTVLFVSHNLAAIRSLCAKSLLLQNGMVQSMGPTESVLNDYMHTKTKSNYVDLEKKIKEAPANQSVLVKSIELIGDSEVAGTFQIHKKFRIIVQLENKNVDADMNVNLFFYNVDNTLIFASCSTPEKVPKGKFQALCEFPENFFNDISYTISVMVVANNQPLITIDEAMNVEAVEVKRKSDWHGQFPGLVRPVFNWSINY